MRRPRRTWRSGTCVRMSRWRRTEQTTGMSGSAWPRGLTAFLGCLRASLPTVGPSSAGTEPCQARGEIPGLGVAPVAMQSHSGWNHTGTTLGSWCLLPLHGARRGPGLGSRFSWCAAVCGSLFGRTNPFCSLFLTLCLPVAPLRSLSLSVCPGLGSLTKPFTSSRTPISLATCMCFLQTISCPTGSGGPGPSTACPSEGRGDAGRYWALVRYRREDDAAECLQMVGF